MTTLPSVPPVPHVPANRLTATVVICAYTDERWELLGEAVASVEAQTFPAQLVLVIDHHDDLLARASERWPHHVVVPNRARRGLSGARNTGVAEASGEVVAFLDDDAAADIDWLARMVAHFSRPEVGGVGGSVVPRWLGARGTGPGWFPDEFLWVVGCSYVGLPSDLAEVRNPIGASMAFRRAVLVEAGGFSEEVGRVGAVPVGCEETELSLRAGALGFTVLYDPEAVVHHAVPESRGSLRYFVRRCQAEGRSKAVVSRMARAASAGGAGSKALATEQAYVRTVLPRGVLRAAARGGAIVLGLVVTSAGYAEGRLRRTSSVNPLAASPRAAVATRREEAA